MKTKKIVSLLIAAMLAVTLIAGCTPPQQSTPAQPATIHQEQPAPVTEPEPEPEAEPDTSVTITDVVGRTVTLLQPARRVVGTHNPTMNIPIVLGGGGIYIAGFGNKAMAIGLYDYVFPELRDDVTQIGMGREINFESVLEVGADLAILPERFADLADRFEEIGVPAAVIIEVNQSFDSIITAVTLMGVLLGEEERAVQINAFFSERIAVAAEIAEQVTDRPRAMFTSGSSATSVAHASMLQSVMMETAGAINVARDISADDAFVEVSIEEIIGWNPEVIFIPAYASYTVEDILNDSAWSSIQAIQDGRVYIFPSHLDPWDFPTPSTAMGLAWLLNALHPELYSMERVIQDANEFYQLVYGQTFTAEQLGLQ
ncbi:MAG: ABC transporter substrate-binding protein [Oscillospiraceae bacterium]|nr:ABC transporter substrate-binding protein [Oscillospiraceae bacterium]